MKEWKSDYKKITVKPLFKKPIAKKAKKITGELELFRAIVRQRGSKSEVSGENIEDITVSSLAHILSKKMFPAYRLNPDNIIILTPDEHQELDQGSQEYLRTLPEWDFVFEKIEKLKEDYKLQIPIEYFV